jgi:hypothetical protein
MTFVWWWVTDEPLKRHQWADEAYADSWSSISSRSISIQHSGNSKKLDQKRIDIMCNCVCWSSSNNRKRGARFEMLLHTLEQTFQAPRVPVRSRRAPSSASIVFSCFSYIFWHFCVLHVDRCLLLPCWSLYIHVSLSVACCIIRKREKKKKKLEIRRAVDIDAICLINW